MKNDLETAKQFIKERNEGQEGEAWCNNNETLAEGLVAYANQVLMIKPTGAPEQIDSCVISILKQLLIHYVKEGEISSTSKEIAVHMEAAIRRLEC